MEPELSIIIPTFNEEATIQDTIQKTSHTLRCAPTPFEIIIVDDSSTDKTQLIVTDLILRKYPVRLVTRTKDPGLSQSVLEGFKHARGWIVAVTDADMSHDINLIPQMVNEIKTNNVDIVIGSRYMPGGGIEQWPIKRRLISWGATFLAKLPFPNITDPVSGFFCIKRDLVLHTPSLKPRGYKILLEFLGKCHWHTTKELPYVFQNRTNGESKLGLKQILQYAKQVIDIAWFPGRARDEIHKIMNFAAVGITGIAVNTIALATLTEVFKLPLLGASFVGIEMAILWNFVLNDHWTFKDVKCEKTWLQRMFAFNIVSIGGMVINIAVLGILTALGVYYLIANFIGIGLAFGWNFVVNRRTTWH